MRGSFLLKFFFFIITAKKTKSVLRSLVSIYSQNARGLKTNSALTEAIEALRRRSGFSAGLHETWRTGLEEIEEDGFVFLGAAPAVQNGRGSKGVGILLSPLAVAAWRAAGAVVHNDVGPRVIAVRLEVEDSSGRKKGLFFTCVVCANLDSPGHRKGRI